MVNFNTISTSIYWTAEAAIAFLLYFFFNCIRNFILFYPMAPSRITLLTIFFVLPKMKKTDNFDNLQITLAQLQNLV